MPDSHASQTLYVGLMSGTSMDGIDAALVKFGDHQCDVLATLDSPYPDELRDALIVATQCPAECTVDTIGKLDQWVGECFRDAAIALTSATLPAPYLCALSLTFFISAPS